MHARTLAVLIVVGLSGGLALGAQAADVDEGFADPARQEVERMREAGEEACREALDATSRLGERLRAMSREMARALSKSGAELTREMAPALRELADRLNEMARQLERREQSDTI